MKRGINILILLFIVVKMYSNGGLTVNSTVTGTGSPVFIDMPNVHIISEKLYIKFEHDFCHIKVKYILWNHSNTDYTNMDYGFPIDYMLSEKETDSYVKNVKFNANGNILTSYSNSPEITLNKEFSVYRKWYFANLSIPGNSFLYLDVEYSVMNGSIMDGHSPLILYELESGYSYLNYDFSPAAHWGDGIIRDFYIEVDATPIELSGRYHYFPYYFPNVRPDDGTMGTEIYSKGMYAENILLEKNGNFYTYRTRNFDLKKAKPLIISYGYGPKLESILSKKMNNNEYSISASTKTAKYPVSNLTDMNLETAWVAGKDGIGEWIEFTFKDKLPIGGFTIVNGYVKNENTFYENNRVKKIQIDITQKRKKKSEINSYTLDIEDFKYEIFYFENLIDKMGWIDFFDYGNIDYWAQPLDEDYIEKVRITILDVYPGSKHNDACISEILFYK